ncbi:MAG: hypothetical protein HC803_06345 [Saprospiraceae bacterium]|nr:hypothetical protein [Saprospiraceae bacterium]
MKNTFNTTDKIDGTDSLELTIFWFGKPIDSTDSLAYADTLSRERVSFRVIQSEYGKEYANNMRHSMKSEELLDALKNEKKSKERLLEEQNALQLKIENLEKRRSLLSTVSNEYKATYPELERIGYAEVEQTTDSTDCIYLPTLFFDWNRKISKAKNKRLRTKNCNEFPKTI